MKKIVMVGISLLLLTACGSSGSSSSNGPMSGGSPVNRVMGGDIPFQRYSIEATPASKFSSMMCSVGKGSMVINNNVVTGTIVSAFKKPYIISGTYIPETGEIEGGFAEAEQSIAHYTGMMNISEGEGSWSDDFGCSGTWKAIKE